jgi:hypothetical protein
MKHAVQQHFVIGCVLAVVGGIVVWTMFVCNTFACIPNANDRPGGGESSSGSGSNTTKLVNQSAFVITGSPTKPMSPGVEVPIDLRLQNTNKTAMSVTDLEVVVRAVDAPNATAELPCLVEDFTVSQVPDNIDLTLPPEATSSLSGLSVSSAEWPHVGMLNTSVNQDGCKGASVILDFSGSGAVDDP